MCTNRLCSHLFIRKLIKYREIRNLEWMVQTRIRTFSIIYIILYRPPLLLAIPLKQRSFFGPMAYRLPLYVFFLDSSRKRERNWRWICIICMLQSYNRRVILIFCRDVTRTHTCKRAVHGDQETIVFPCSRNYSSLAKH